MGQRLVTVALFFFFYCRFLYHVKQVEGRVYIVPMPQSKNQMEEKLNKILVYSLLAAKNVLTLEDVTLLTGLSKSYLYKLTCTKQIPYYRPNGKQIYFDRSEIEAWMKQNRVATESEVEQKAANYISTGIMQKGGIG